MNKNLVNGVTVSVKSASNKKTLLSGNDLLPRGYYVVASTNDPSVLVGDVVFKGNTAIWNLRTGENIIFNLGIGYTKPNKVNITWS